MLAVETLEHLFEGAQQIEQRHLAEIELGSVFLGDLPQLVGGPGPHAAALAVDLGQGLRRLFEAAVLEQPLDQLLAWILFHVLTFERLRPGQQQL